MLRTIKVQTCKDHSHFTRNPESTIFLAFMVLMPKAKLFYLFSVAFDFKKLCWIVGSFGSLTLLTNIVGIMG